MLTVLPSGQWTERGKRSVEIEGADHGMELSFHLEDRPPQTGPRLHKHPYGETWVVIAGQAEFSDGARTVPVGTGDVIYVGPGTPHKFRSIGEAKLRIVCIHDSGRFSTEWLED